MKLRRFLQRALGVSPIRESNFRAGPVVLLSKRLVHKVEYSRSFLGDFDGDLVVLLEGLEEEEEEEVGMFGTPVLLLYMRRVCSESWKLVGAHTHTTG